MIELSDENKAALAASTNFLMDRHGLSNGDAVWGELAKAHRAGIAAGIELAAKVITAQPFTYSERGQRIDREACLVAIGSIAR